MIAYLRQGLTLICLSVLAVGSVIAFTGPSRSRLQAAQDEFAAVARSEAELLVRMNTLTAAKALKGAFPADLIWPGTDDASVEIAQQQTLLDFANAAGLQILSFGATQGPENIGHPTKAYEIEVEGGHGEVAKFLADIEQATPRLAISYLWMRQIPIAEGQTIAPVNMRLAVWGFRQGEAVQP